MARKPLPTALHASFHVEFRTGHVETAKLAVLAFQDLLRKRWTGRDAGALHVVDLVAITADFTEDGQPLLAVIMEALVDRGWRVDGNTHSMISPLDGQPHTLQDAITVQTYREIGTGSET